MKLKPKRWGNQRNFATRTTEVSRSLMVWVFFFAASLKSSYEEPEWERNLVVQLSTSMLEACLADEQS